MAPTAEPPGAWPITAGDRRLALWLALPALAIYGLLAWRLAGGEYLDYYNLAFDFDPSRAVTSLATTAPEFLGFKHPLFELLRPLAWPLLGLGLDAKQASGLLIAGFGAASVALCFLFFRAAGIECGFAVPLSGLFAVSSTQLFISVIVETYGVAAFSIVLTWLLAALRLTRPGCCPRLPYAAALLTIGTTVTNVMQSVLAEGILAWREGGPVRAFRRCLRFGLIVGILTALLCLIAWFDTLRAALQDPVQAAKEVYWLRTKGERAGLATLLETFLGFGFVAPRYSWVMLPGDIPMRDFRSWEFVGVGAVAAPLWLAFLASGAVGAACHPRYRWLALGLALALVGNFLLHLDFQFRGSLFLYAGHMHFLVLGLAAGLAPHLSARSVLGRVYAGFVLLLGLLIAANNLPILFSFTGDFQAVQMPCPKPCFDASQN